NCANRLHGRLARGLIFFTLDGFQIRATRLLQWHWIDVGVAHCFDSSSNKFLSPTIPSGVSCVKTLQRTANPRPNTGEGTRQRERNDGKAPPSPGVPSLLPGSVGIGKLF